MASRREPGRVLGKSAPSRGSTSREVGRSVKCPGTEGRAARSWHAKQEQGPVLGTQAGTSDESVEGVAGGMGWALQEVKRVRQERHKISLAFFKET